ncbi:hemin uptake protein HemP [Sulfitobacter guttiformis]|uniref:Hemin uptake protein hemP n=1 Tax=Sulfitobacter guttiformis TaxID=74349 RepID=A0A420DHE7_9RHOB|nr:hemin uptake protein HemP [Sulfitobacter guttiformis]KIN72627.1 HemP-like protein [Sulfitobacter guttiformis KCTC 32187]RKE93642.1 hemin uptake protein hemP [Sulfitobacter guttiformis]
MSFHTPPQTKLQVPGMPTYAAGNLTKGGDLAQIVLDDQVYTLRITRANKLILTK